MQQEWPPKPALEALPEPTLEALPEPAPPRDVRCGRVAAAAGGRPRAGGERVLVIDDDERIVRLYRRWLEEAGYELVACSSGREALEWIRAGERIDLIICDLSMPGMSGMDFYGILRKLDPAAAERVRFLTGGAFSPDSARFLEAMVDRCREKPIWEEQMLEWIRSELA